MRKSFDGLTGLVRSEFCREPNDGSLFLFINRRRDRIKILYWEVGGFALWYKRLESGSFETVSGRNGTSVVTIDAAELTMLLSGISLQSVKRRKRFVA
jgi:transposase